MQVNPAFRLDDEQNRGKHGNEHQSGASRQHSFLQHEIPTCFRRAALAPIVQFKTISPTRGATETRGYG